ncbi:MAG: 4-alpha-glucanotransferase, partial [Patescibacteria group bacterium]
MVDLKADGTTPTMVIERFKLTKEHISGSQEVLFDAIASFVKQFLAKHNLTDSYDLGFTFSFEVNQADIDKGITVRMSKGFTTTGIVGKDVVALLRDAFKRKGVNNVRVVAIDNDTTGTQVARAYLDNNTSLGVILGTGTNICVRLPMDKIIKQFSNKDNYKATHMIVNMESGNFNKNLPRTKYDKLLDSKSTNPNEAWEEKMVSGMYLGELMRLTLLDLINQKLLFRGKTPKILSSYQSFETRYIGDIEALDLNKRMNIWKLRLLFKKLLLSRKDAKIIQLIANLIATRSARVAASLIAGALLYIDPNLTNKHTVAIDGSVFEKHYKYQARMHQAFRELLSDKASNITTTLTHDGSGVGAAIIAAVASKAQKIQPVKAVKDIFKESVVSQAASAVTVKQNNRAIDYLSPIFAGKRIMGGLLPLFSVRSKTGQGIGTIEDYYKMAELYQSLGWTVLQIPPMNICNMDSPYSVESSRLMDWLYASVDILLGKSSYSKFDGLVIRSKAAEEFLESKRVEIEELRRAKETNFTKVKPIIYETLKLLYKDFIKLPQSHKYSKEYRAYQQKMGWLKDHVLHLLLKERFIREKDMWRDWDFRLWGEDLATRKDKALKEAENYFRHFKEGGNEIDMIDFYSFMQFVFYHQWDRFKVFAHSRNIGLAGDMTFGLDGADLWIRQDLFAFEKDLKRRYSQGVPPDLFSDMGQYWQFYMYRWEKPETVNFIFDRFKYLLGFYDYVRFDHALGCYRGYRFLEDADNKMNLKDLGIWDEISPLLKEGKDNPEKQDEIASKIYGIVLNKLAKTSLLTEEDKKYFFTPSNSLSRDSAMYVVRRSDKQPVFEPKLSHNGWERYNYVTEKRIYDASYTGSWDFLPFSKKYMKKYLFPDDSQRAPQTEDSVRVAYFVPAPGEELISGLLRVAQEEGKVFITELLGIVPEKAKESVDTLAGAIDYAPGIFQDNPAFWLSDEFKNKWTMVVHSLQDSINMEGKKATGSCNPTRSVTPEQAKITMSDKERMNWLGPLTKSKALLSILMWPDWGNWPGSWTERITNIPGTQTGNWSIRTPFTMEELLAASRGEKTSAEAKAVMDFARELTQYSKRTLADASGLAKYLFIIKSFIEKYLPVLFRGSKRAALINTFPYFGDFRQQRFLDQKFEVWALVNKKPKNINVIIGEGNKRISLPMHLVRVGAGLPRDTYLYSALLAADTLKEGDHYFRVAVNGKESEGKGWLQAVKRG